MSPLMKNRRILLGCSLLKTTDIYAISSSLKTSELVVLIHDDRWGNYSRNSNNENISSYYPCEIKYSSLMSRPSENKRNVRIGSILEYVLSDPNSYLIAERVMLGGYFSSVSHKLYLIESIIINAINLIEKYHVDRFVQSNIPHNIDFYIAKVCEFYGIEVYYTRLCSALSRVQLVKNLNNAIIIKPTKVLDENESILLAKTIINKYSGDYDSAIPDYEIANRRKSGAQLISLKSIMADFSRINSLKKLLYIPYSLCCKYISYKEFNLNTSSQPDSGRIIKLFLHYQPEASTIPTGGLYSSQHRAISAIASLAGCKFSLCIREHPSTFRLSFDPRYRWKNFYSLISKFPHTYLLPHQDNTFTELDSCHSVATVNGAIGFEAICRGIPCLTFSQTFYSGLEGVFQVSVSDIDSNLINSLLTKKINSKVLVDGLSSLLQETFECDVEINSSIPALVSLCEIE